MQSFTSNQRGRVRYTRVKLFREIKRRRTSCATTNIYRGWSRRHDDNTFTWTGTTGANACNPTIAKYYYFIILFSRRRRWLVSRDLIACLPTCRGALSGHSHRESRVLLSSKRGKIKLIIFIKAFKRYCAYNIKSVSPIFGFSFCNGRDDDDITKYHSKSVVFEQRAIGSQL